MRFAFICRVAVLAVLAIWCQVHQAAAQPVPAPSFDCARAANPDEKIICADPLLRQADHDLAVAYRAARAASADAAHRAMLKNDEHEWILQRNGECKITRFTVLTKADRPGFSDCLLDQYAERIADLGQMKLHPLADPASISSPIRRSFLAASPAPPLPADVTLTTFQLPAGARIAALAWRADGALLVLDVAAGGGGALYGWRPGDVMKLADVPDAGAFSRLCPLADGVVALIALDRATDGLVSATGVFSTGLPAAAASACGGSASVLMAAGADGAVLNLGPSRLGIFPVPRFLTLTTPAGRREIAPPVRIDSRYHLAAVYAPFAGVFTVSPADDAAMLDYATVRRWSKTDCLAYWTVDPKAASAAKGCIPFGPYETVVPVPLLTKTSTYFSADGFGLYRLSAAGVQPVLAGNFGPAAVSPDGCRIAMDVQAGGAGQAGPAVQLAGSGTVTVLTVCPLATSATTANSPAAP
jgi:uncharacterized protein